MDSRNKCRNCKWYVTKLQPDKDDPGCGYCHGACPAAQLTSAEPHNHPKLWANWPLVPGNDRGCRHYEPRRK